MFVPRWYFKCVILFIVDITNENKNLKDDIETLRDETRNLSITLKRVKSDFKDTTKKNNVEKNAIEKELRKLKEIKKYKQVIKKAAEVEEVTKLKVEREETTAVRTVNLGSESQTLLEYTCPHIPQCIWNEPRPPPLGPRTLEQAQLDNELIKNEAIQTFTQEALDFLKQDNDETLDDTIKKMEAFKNLLEPDCEESEFDELIQMVKTAKEAIENLNKSIEYDDDY